MEVRGSQWKSVKVYMVVCGRRTENMVASESRWKAVEVHVWKYMEGIGSRRKSYLEEIYGNTFVEIN